MAQKHTEGPEGDQHDLVRSQKSGSGLTEMESNCGRPMSPMGQRGLIVITLCETNSSCILKSCCLVWNAFICTVNLNLLLVLKLLGRRILHVFMKYLHVRLFLAWVQPFPISSGNKGNRSIVDGCAQAGFSYQLSVFAYQHKMAV